MTSFKEINNLDCWYNTIICCFGDSSLFYRFNFEPNLMKIQFNLPSR